jgi:hypothetical protein
VYCFDLSVLKRKAGVFLVSLIEVTLFDSSNTPLMWAAASGHLDVVQQLLQAQANVNAKDNLYVQYFTVTPFFFVFRMHK